MTEARRALPPRRRRRRGWLLVVVPLLMLLVGISIVLGIRRQADRGNLFPPVSSTRLRPLPGFQLPAADPMTLRQPQP